MRFKIFDDRGRPVSLATNSPRLAKQLAHMREEHVLEIELEAGDRSAASVCRMLREVMRRIGRSIRVEVLAENLVRAFASKPRAMRRSCAQ